MTSTDPRPAEPDVDELAQDELEELIDEELLSDPDEPEADLELVVLDMAGTTIADDGLVEQAFAVTAERIGIGATDAERARALEYVRDTMGQSKIDVFRAITGDEERAAEANRVFEQAYGELVDGGGVQPIPGAAELIRALRDAGVAVVLTTGFSPATRDALLERLGWTDLADLVLAPADAGRGRPFPDLPLTALLRTGGSSVRAMIVVGDTASDIASGLAAGAGLVVGVLTGAHDRETLLEAGADAVIDSVRDLPELLGL